MNFSKLPSRAALLTSALVLCTGAAQATVLFDAATGSPASQGWLNTGLGSVQQGTTGGVYSLNTSAMKGTQWGNAVTNAVTLDPAAGFDLNFSLRVLAEDHGSNNDRAGFSLIFTGADPKQALELGFWSDSVWAYRYDTANSAFVHGNGAQFDTSVWNDYDLQVRSNVFTLKANGTTLFSGELQNYTGQGAPYSMNNFLFFGDDTSSASSSVQMRSLSVTDASPAPSTVPEAPTAALALLALGLMAKRKASKK